ncbi:MAG TPA: HAMP domain-containing sensor histidine kinase [Myxococcaceae bacterium]|nr:HAMP domain-containing sensor histidine kinase [Myxococcaceae bacterium]
MSTFDEKLGRGLALRKRVDAVFALLNLPGAWRGQEPDAIARSLVQVLVRLLPVDAALVQIGEGDTVIEHHHPEGIDATALFTAATKGERWAPAYLDLQLGAPASTTAVHAIAIDLPGERGSAVVASSRSSFPTEEELLVLETAVTHAAVAIASCREARTQRLLADERSRLERVNAMLASLYARAEFLADASAILFSSLDIDDGLSRVAQLAIPRLGDWMVIFADGRTIAVHREPGRAEEARERAQGFASAFGAPRAGAADGMALAPITAGGGALGVLVLGSDGEGATIPEETLSLLERLGERCGLAVDTARRYREAREADQRKDEFLAILGHELRHPLSPIVTALSLMKLREPRVFERERAIMERQVGHLSRLVDDLLDVSRITRGKIQIEQERVDLHGVVARAVEMIAPQFERRGQHVMIVSSSEPLTVQGDAMRLEQVVTNLLTNAAKYTDPGGRIRVTLASDGGQAELRVSDSGMGIAPEILPRVFEAFVQDQASLDRAHGGLGLGLSIVRRLVEMHGGTVAAHSEGRGRGSEFVVRLPLAASASHPDAPPERATA